MTGFNLILKHSVGMISTLSQKSRISAESYYAIIYNMYSFTMVDILSMAALIAHKRSSQFENSWILFERSTSSLEPIESDHLSGLSPLDHGLLAPISFKRAASEK